MTFDKKGTAVTKKKKIDSSTVQEETCKVAKGGNSIKYFFSQLTQWLFFDILSFHPWLSLHPSEVFFTHVVFKTGSFFVQSKTCRLHNTAYPCSCFSLFCAISGPSPSQKKTSFHKIVRKHKHKKEKPGAVDTGELQCVFCSRDNMLFDRLIYQCSEGQEIVRVESLKHMRWNTTVWILCLLFIAKFSLVRSIWRTTPIT